MMDIKSQPELDIAPHYFSPPVLLRGGSVVIIVHLVLCGVAA